MNEERERAQIEREVRSWLSTTAPAQALGMLSRAELHLAEMRTEYYQALATVKCLRCIIEEDTDEQ